MPKKKGFEPANIHKIGVVHKTSSTKTRVAINEFDDRSSVDIRQWYKRKGMDDFAPGKGISIPVEALPTMVKAMKKALRVAREQGLLEEEE